jgi:hypothetical protein
MPASKTAINILAYQVGTNTLLGSLRGYEYDPAPVYADVHPVNTATASKQLVKRSPTLRCTEIMPNGSLAATNLAVTVFTVAGTAYVGTLRSFTLDARNEFEEASGLNDLVSFGQLVKASCTITGQLIVASSATLHDLLLRSYSATPGDHVAAATITVAGVTIGGNFSIAARASGQAGQLQTVDVTLEASGNLTSPTGSSVLATALTGSGAVDVHLDTGFGKIGTPAARIPALITSVRMSASDSQLVELVYDFKLQSAENLVASS